MMDPSNIKRSTFEVIPRRGLVAQIKDAWKEGWIQVGIVVLAVAATSIALMSGVLAF